MPSNANDTNPDGRPATTKVSSTMPPSEIIALLVEHRCPDITDQLDLEECGNVPMARGGFGDIYRGELSGGESVAIKCSRLCLQDDPDGRKVLRIPPAQQSAARELFVWSRLKHDNVLELLGLAQFQNQIAMVSPWMDNGTLREYLKRNPNADRYQLCIGISEGVAYLHQNNTIHGDIKSANVLVSSEGVAKLADFGCTELKNFSSLDFSTTTGGSKLSARWAAPEILSSGKRSKATDVYALGMTLLEIITGEIPFSEKRQDIAVIRAVSARQTPDIPKEFPSFEKNEANLLRGVMLRCWAYEPSDRPDSNTVKTQLKGIGQAVAPSPEPPYQECVDAQCKDFSNLYGLIIGVDKYQSRTHQDLNECVSNASTIFSWLTETLQAPRNHLLCLFDEQATRKGILDAFRNHLILNEKIRHSDPILIYFSGHGDRQKAPPEWHSSDGYLKLILPHDASPCAEASDIKSHPKPSTCDANINTSHYDPNKHYKHGIPDRTLGALIHQLSKAKGDNITVILDSSYSAGATGGHDQETHVLLAACNDGEYAMVAQGGGLSEGGLASLARPGSFTQALLIALQQCDLATTNYSSLMRSVQKHMITTQASQMTFDRKAPLPQCEGRNQDRLLFRRQLASAKGAIRLDRDLGQNKFRIEAGSASGIQLGTELGVYSGDMQGTSPPIARLVAVQVNATTSTLCIQDADSNVEIPGNAYAFVTKYTGHTFRILIDDQLKISPLWQEVLDKLRSQSIDIVWSEPEGPSDLALIPSEEDIVIQRQDPSVVQLRPRNIVLRQQLSSCQLARMLSAVAHFHFHLRRRNPESPLRGLVGMKLIELKTKPGRAWGVQDYVPVSANLDDLLGGSLSSGTVAELQSAPDKQYGLQLTNTSNWPLFAWVLSFSLDDYSIKFIYNPARNTKPPLSTNGRVLAVGYGDVGVEPLRIHTSGYSDRECGVLMLIVSDTWIDISHIAQPSIFEPMGDAGVWDEGGGSRREWPPAFEPVDSSGVRSDEETSESPGSVLWDVLAVGVSIRSSEYL